MPRLQDPDHVDDLDLEDEGYVVSNRERRRRPLPKVTDWDPDHSLAREAERSRSRLRRATREEDS